MLYSCGCVVYNVHLWHLLHLPGLTRFGDRSGPRERSQPREGRSLLSMVGDDYMDANVAANEKEV